MPAKLERNRGGAAAGDQAPQTPRVPHRGEQRGRGAGAGGDDMRVLEPNASAAAMMMMMNSPIACGDSSESLRWECPNLGGSTATK